MQTVAFYISFIALGLVFSALGPTLPGLASNTHSTLKEISIIFTAQGFGLLAGNFLSGRLYDRKPAFPILVWIVIALSLLLLLTPLVTALWQLAVVMFLLGAGAGAIDVAGNTLLIWIHGDRVGTRMNALHFFFGVGALLAPIFAAQAIAWTGGIRWAYWTLAALVLPAALLFARTPSPVAPPRILAARGAKTPWLLVALLMAAFLLFVGAETSFGNWIYTYAVTLKLATATTGGYLTSVFWGMFTLGRLLSIPLANRVRPRIILLVDFIGGAAALGLLLLFPTQSWAVWTAAALYGLALANVYPTLILLSGRHLSMTASISSLFMFAGSIGGMVTPWLIGQRFESSGPQVAIVIILAALVLAALDLVLFLVVSPVPALTNESSGVSHAH
ncbi:MAG: MFS transporter [Caldilineales bacterium]